MNYLVKSVMKSKPAVQWLVSQSMRVKVPEYAVKEFPFVQNDRVHNILKSAFNHAYGGVRVIVCPSGCGISTSLRKCANEFIESGGNVRIIGSELESPDDFYRAFGGSERRHDLFDVLPKRSTIAIDQLEKFKILPMEMESLILHMAVESRRTAECNIIIAVSCPIMAEIVLNLNGLDKIYQLGKKNDFQWDKSLVEKYVELGFNGWKQEDKDDLIELGTIAMSPAFLHGVLTLYSTGLPVDKKNLHDCALRYQDEWSKYK